jgi:hypothetical protein
VQLRAHRNHNQRGVVVVALAVCTVLLFGAAALAIDAGRAFVNHSEAQTFADAAALAAAHELDGARRGILAARQAVLDSDNRWDFNQQPFEAPVIEFARPEAPFVWESDPPNPAGYTRVKVTVSLRHRRFFLPATAVVSAAAAAEQAPTTHFYQGLFPFAIASEAVLAPGSRYPLQQWWGATDQAATRLLADFQPPDEDVILDEPLPASSAAPEDAAAILAKRLAQDTDSEAASYQEYVAAGKGNGRRLVAMPIVAGTKVKTCGRFLLLPGSQAEYIGRAYTIRLTGAQR